MPIYEYVCQDCGEKYEKFVRSLNAKVELICPECGSQHAEKVFSVFGAVGSDARSGSAGSGFGSSATTCGPVG
ncbi:MAG: zinc ribbon domain-containing protein [Anaerolineae bacterium]|nr:zinc ribbon domain-containing protein [Anaerolineae bacterium]